MDYTVGGSPEVQGCGTRRVTLGGQGLPVTANRLFDLIRKSKSSAGDRSPPLKSRSVMRNAKIIADSISEDGIRLTTMQVVMHRFVLAEFNTHRALSRNSASSRAIPVEKQLVTLTERPAWPVEWPAEQSGMQGGSSLTGNALKDAQELFYEVHENTVTAVERYLHDHPEKEDRLHKSLINRLLEPFMWHTVVATSTEWNNFFAQRCSPLAQPEIRVAAQDMQDVLEASSPRLIRAGQYHLPYITDEDELEAIHRYGADSAPSVLIAISAARCARVSYLTQEGTRDFHKDLELYDRLVSAEPPHWSPLEHVATPGNSEWGNFDGWVQIRHIISGQHTNTN